MAKGSGSVSSPSVRAALSTSPSKTTVARKPSLIKSPKAIAKLQRELTEVQDGLRAAVLRAAVIEKQLEQMHAPPPAVDGKFNIWSA